ncbi:MAG: hypothetical protein JSR33_00780 [Proteobacteria bacterium]|nr:hypothetical protein [Pseudomonadota bacterium]
MRAIMSDQLRAILRNPEGRRELRRAMAKLDMTKSKPITVDGKHYTVQLMSVESKIK